MTALLEVSEVSKRFGGVVANDAVSLRAEPGKIIGLIGPNGSGKTSLFNAIVGHHPIDSGSIRFQGEEISKLRVGQIARRGLLRTFQQSRVYTGLDCLQNMRISSPHAHEGLRRMFSRIPKDEDQRAAELLAFVGLHGKRHQPAGALSYGQRKLLEFAMALMNGPQLLLLDEPTAGVNPTMINGMIDRLRQANQQFGVTLLVIEHNMRVIMNLAEHIYCLAHGRLLADGAPADIRNDPRVIDAYLGQQ